MPPTCCRAGKCHKAAGVHILNHTSRGARLRVKRIISVLAARSTMDVAGTAIAASQRWTPRGLSGPMRFPESFNSNARRRGTAYEIRLEHAAVDDRRHGGPLFVARRYQKMGLRWSRTADLRTRPRALQVIGGS